MTQEIETLAPRFETDVLTLRARDLAHVEAFLGARMLRVPVSDGPWRDRVSAYARALARQLEGGDYDLVHLNSAWGAHTVWDYAGASVRRVYEVSRPVLGPAGFGEPEAERALAREEEHCLENADLILVSTEGARGHLEAMGLGARTMVVPPGVNTERFDWEAGLEPHPGWLRDVLNGHVHELPESGVATLLFVGQVREGAGMRLLLGALALLRRAYDVRLVLAGPIASSFREAFDESISRLHLEGQVIALGAVRHSALPRIIAQATICVAPTAPDPEIHPLVGCPNKVLEYLSCRAPVVAPRWPAVAEVIREGQDGLLFRPGDVEDLAARLARLLDDVSLRESLAESGYWMVRSRFTAAARRRRLLGAYARLVPPEHWLPPLHMHDATRRREDSGSITSRWAQREDELEATPTAEAHPLHEMMREGARWQTAQQVAEEPSAGRRTRLVPDASETSPGGATDEEVVTAVSAQWLAVGTVESVEEEAWAMGPPRAAVVSEDDEHTLVRNPHHSSEM